ncbi:electron transfer flavoprotein subunit alpha/FixB family protein [Trueperella sp. LYQ141]
MTTWIVTTEPTIAPLCQLAVGERHAVVVGDCEITGVDKVTRLAISGPAEAYAPQVVAAVAAQPGDIILVVNNSVGRVYAGALAAAFHAPMLTGVRNIASGAAVLGRYGGMTFQDVQFDGVAVGLVEPGDIPASAQSHISIQAHDAHAIAPYPATCESEETNAHADINLNAARRIIGVGRGFVAKEDIDLARQLAAVIEAEVGCTRPLVEGKGWMERDAYLGVSGHTVSPQLYIAVGISGQIHHTAGIDQSETIVAINNDETAAIFDIADYGLVGNLYEVLPKMTKAVRQHKNG